MANNFENDSLFSTPGPKSRLERRLIKNELDGRIAASKERKPVLPASPLDGIAERPTIGALPTPPVDDARMIELDEPAPEEADGDAEEVTENTRVRVTINREPPSHK